MSTLLVDGMPHDGPCPEIVKVPRCVATCPECKGTLYMQVDEWETDSSTPTENGFTVDCEREPDADDPDFWEKQHRNWQGEWAPVFDRVAVWAKQHVRVQVTA